MIHNICAQSSVHAQCIAAGISVRLMCGRQRRLLCGRQRRHKNGTGACRAQKRVFLRRCLWDSTDAFRAPACMHACMHVLAPAGVAQGGPASETGGPERSPGHTGCGRPCHACRRWILRTAHPARAYRQNIEGGAGERVEQGCVIGLKALDKAEGCPEAA